MDNMNMNDMDDMNVYDETVLLSFISMQGQLFPKEVASTLEEAEAFLEDCMAVVCRNLNEVREYFEEMGADISQMDNQELSEAPEVFSLPDGRYLVVEA